MRNQRKPMGWSARPERGSGLQTTREMEFQAYQALARENIFDVIYCQISDCAVHHYLFL